MSQINTVKDIYERETYRTIRQFKHILDIQSLNVGNVVSTDGTQLIWSAGSSGGGTWGSITGTLSAQTDLQSALDLKANLASPTFTGTVVLPSTTSIGTITNTELSYVDGVTSSIQTQLDSKLSSASFVPAGSNTQIQFNNSGAFGASANLTYNTSTLALTGIQTITDTTAAGSGSLAGSALNIAQTWNTTGAPTAIKLNVTNTASGAAALLMDLQIAGVSKFKIDKTGQAVLSSGNLMLPVNYAIINATSTSYMYFNQNVKGLVHGDFGWRFEENGVGHVETSGAVVSYDFDTKFNPTSGTATHANISVNPTVNQTGGANGITRGIYINPTLTAAADFRALESTNGKVILTDTFSAVTGSLAGSLLTLNQTWNTTGTPTAIKLNVTDSTSNAASKLIDLQVGGSTKFFVRKDGYAQTGSLFLQSAGSGTLYTLDSIYRTVDNDRISVFNGGGGAAGVIFYGSSHATLANVIDFKTNSVSNRLTINAAGTVSTSTNGAASVPILTSVGTWFSGGSATTTKPHWLIEPTGATSTAWSTSGTGLGINAASGFTGRLSDWQLNGISKAYLTYEGAFNLNTRTTNEGISFDGNNDKAIYASSSVTTLSQFGAISIRLWDGSAYVADKFRFTLASTESMLQFGGTTSSFPAIKRSSAGLVARLADDSADTTITASNVISTATVRLKGYTVATLPTGVVGDLAYVTDALTPAFGVTIVGGGAVVTPVFYDGTTWTAR